LSPDGKHVAYVKWSGAFLSDDSDASVVVDGKRGKKYGGVVGRPVFSPDSKHVAYVAYGDAYTKWFVVVDGVEGKRYDWMYGPGRNTDTESKARVFFDSPDKIHYFAQLGNNVYLVEEVIR